MQTSHPQFCSHFCDRCAQWRIDCKINYPTFIFRVDFVDCGVMPWNEWKMIFQNFLIIIFRVILKIHRKFTILGTVPTKGMHCPKYPSPKRRRPISGAQTVAPKRTRPMFMYFFFLNDVFEKNKNKSPSPNNKSFFFNFCLVLKEKRQIQSYLRNYESHKKYIQAKNERQVNPNLPCKFGHFWR